MFAFECGLDPNERVKALEDIFEEDKKATEN